VIFSHFSMGPLMDGSKAAAIGVFGGDSQPESAA
jgi:hypothetical protein